MKFARSSYPMSLEHTAAFSLLQWVAIYFMVRALDNIGQGLNPNWAFTKCWRDFFPDGKPGANA